MAVDCGSARDRLGQTLGGKYHLKEVLGAGGSAVVYLATDPDGQPIAIKVMHDHLNRFDEVRRRFDREGDLGLILDHPSTVKVLDDGMTAEGSPYLALEYLEGESLEERRVRSGGRLDLWETLDFCDQLLAVLEVAHAKNVIHRDIKPSNLFVTKTGLLKVLDFGIARVTDDASATATKTGQTVGTPAFMPPEQALSRPREVDTRTDIWSVGATIFTLLSGEHVHISESSSEHLVKAATLHARSLAKALPGVPSNVEALVARCLSFDKNDRWPSASAMRIELSSVRDDPGRRIGTSTSPPPDRFPDSANITFLLGPSAGRADRGERVSDTAMSLPSKAPVWSPRRRWLLPIAVASTLGLVVMSTVVFVLAFRATRPANAAELTAAPKPPMLPPPLVESQSPSRPPPPPPPTVPDVASAAASAASRASAAPHPAALPASASASAAAIPGAPGAGTRPKGASGPGQTGQAAPADQAGARKPVSRRDVYKPF